MEIGMLRLAGMKTEQCASLIAQALNAVKGVSKTDVSFSASKATVSFDEHLVSLPRLKVAVEEAGYQIKPIHGEDGSCCGGCGG